MSDLPPPAASVTDQIVGQAKDLPQLISMAGQYDPALAASLTPKALLASKSAPGTLLVGVVAWAVSKYGLGWDAQTVDLVAGLGVLAGGYAFRSITRSPIGGLFSGKSNAA